MATRFCSRCGAPLVEGNRFCVKCGQPLALKPLDPTAVPVAKPEPPPVPVPVPVPPPVPTAPAPAPVIVPQITESPKSSGAGVGIGIAAVVLILGGAAGFFVYSQQHRKALSEVRVEVPAAPPVVLPKPTPLAPAPATPPLSTPAVAPSPVVTPEPPPVIPKAPKKIVPMPAISPAAPKADVPVSPTPAIAPPAPRPTSGVLHYKGPAIPQNGEVVFENLPGGRLKFTFDRGAWQPLISRQPDGTQKLTLRSLKPGLQTQCDVGWEIVN